MNKTAIKCPKGQAPPGSDKGLLELRVSIQWISALQWAGDKNVANGLVEWAETR